MKNNKNSSFLLIFTGLFLLVAIISSGCGEASNSTNSRNVSSANRANNSTGVSPNYASAPAGAIPPHYKGDPAAKVVIEEFADYECSACAATHPTVQQIQNAYGNRVKIIFRNFPLQTHPKAYDAAVAAEAAGMQGKFWDMQNLLFREQQFWKTASDHRKMFEDYAQKIGLDLERFRNDMAGMAAKDRVDKDLQRAKALNVGSTPTFFLNGREMPFAETEFNRFRQAIDAELQKTQNNATQTAPATSTTATTPANSNTGGANASNTNANTATGANK